MRIVVDLLLLLLAGQGVCESDPMGFPTQTINTTTEPKIGQHIGDSCDTECSNRTNNIVCGESGECECDKDSPLRISLIRCEKVSHLGERCYFDQSCTIADQHARCIQMGINALCHCKDGYHEASHEKPAKGPFCVQDADLLSADVPTALGVGMGLTIFSGLTCLVLRLFSRARFARPRHYANANLAPPILLSGETVAEVPNSTAHSRTSSQRSNSGSRRQSGSMLAPPSRPGSRRPSNASIRSSASSRSYSLRRAERASAASNHHEPAKVSNSLPMDSTRVASPTPRTPQSTDELLPTEEVLLLQVNYIEGQPLRSLRSTNQDVETKVVSALATSQVTTL